MHSALFFLGAPSRDSDENQGSLVLLLYLKGHRRFMESHSFSSLLPEGQETYELQPNENSLKIWSLASRWVQYEDGEKDEKSMSE